MPKKKQVTLQNSVPGKFIPRDAPPPESAFLLKRNDSRFSAHMAKLLASSSGNNDEDECLTTDMSSNNDEPILHEAFSTTSSHIHSNLFHRRIVTMLETLKKPTNDPSISQLKATQTEYVPQPITFGQLRQATKSYVSAQTSDNKSISHQTKADTGEKHDKSTHLSTTDNTVSLSTVTSVYSAKRDGNKERLHYSSSFTQLLEQQKNAREIQIDNEQTPNLPLPMNQVLAMRSEKAKSSLNPESNTLSLSYSSMNVQSYVLNSSTPKCNPSQNHPSDVDSFSHQHSPQSMSNRQSENRPPPPSYASSVSNTYRTINSTMNSAAQYVNRSTNSSSIAEHSYSGLSASQHPPNTSTSSSLAKVVPSLFVGDITDSLSNFSIRPPQHESPMFDISRLQSSSSQQPNFVSKSNDGNDESQNTEFDREFSRFLYGKSAQTTQREKQKRKALSDPVRNCVEDAFESTNKTPRRVTTHLSKHNIVKEVDDENEEENNGDTEAKRPDICKLEVNLISRRRSQRHFNKAIRKQVIVPPNSALKQRIPSFLRVYSQAPSSNDRLLQWNLFNIDELESFNTMMSRLYKNENLGRVQLYEIYRTTLLSILASKKSQNTNYNQDNIPTAL